MTRGEIGFAVGTADWAEFVPNAVAGSLAGRHEAGNPAETSFARERCLEAKEAISQTSCQLEIIIALQMHSKKIILPR